MQRRRSNPNLGGTVADALPLPQQILGLLPPWV
jgi:hypothetical protein